MSTLRRRIKAEDIKFRFDDGKYLIIDKPMGAHPRGHRPSLKSDKASVGAHQSFSGIQDAKIESSLKSFTEQSANLVSLNLTTDKLMHELKRAYSQILQEKEEQIFRLREEITDLRTLVRILEVENERLRGLK